MNMYFYVYIMTNLILYTAKSLLVFVSTVVLSPNGPTNAIKRVIECHI